MLIKILILNFQNLKIDLTFHCGCKKVGSLYLGYITSVCSQNFLMVYYYATCVADFLSPLLQNGIN